MYSGIHLKGMRVLWPCLFLLVSVSITPCILSVALLFFFVGVLSAR